MPIDTLTGKNLQFPLRTVYLKHDLIQLYLFFRKFFSKFIYPKRQYISEHIESINLVNMILNLFYFINNY